MRIYDEFKSMFITISFLAYVFFVSGLLVNFLQLCSCLIWPFSKELYRKINCYLALGIWSRKSISPMDDADCLFLFLSDFTFLAQWWSKSDCVLYIDRDDMNKVRHEHAIVMSVSVLLLLRGSEEISACLE